MILTGFGILLGLIVLAKVFIHYFMNFPGFNDSPRIISMAFSIFTWGGYAFTSTMFNELNKPSTAAQFLTLPASNLEKLCSAWLVSYVGYTLVGILVLDIIILILEGWGVSWLLNFEMLNRLLTYTIVQSLFLFGAVYFKANNFLSTLVTIIGVAIFWSLWMIWLQKIYPDFSFRVLTKFGLLASSEEKNLMFSFVTSISISGLFIWFSFLRLKKRQIA